MYSSCININKEVILINGFSENTDLKSLTIT